MTRVRASLAPTQRVAIVDLDVPFGSLVVILVKVTIASIPAMLILMVLGAMAMAILGAMGAALLGGLAR